jgi:hypothetical protein
MLRAITRFSPDWIDARGESSFRAKAEGAAGQQMPARFDSRLEPTLRASRNRSVQQPVRTGFLTVWCCVRRDFLRTGQRFGGGRALVWRKLCPSIDLLRSDPAIAGLPALLYLGGGA